MDAIMTHPALKKYNGGDWLQMMLMDLYEQYGFGLSNGRKHLWSVSPNLLKCAI